MLLIWRPKSTLSGPKVEAIGGEVRGDRERRVIDRRRPKTQGDLWGGGHGRGLDNT